MEHAQATKLAIAMPTTGGINKARTTVSLFGLAAELGARGLSPRLLQIDGWDVVCARDLLAANFLKSDATHLLFCDSDMEFSADAALRLLEDTAALRRRRLRAQIFGSRAHAEPGRRRQKL